MTNSILFDNDVVLKLCAYRLAVKTADALSGGKATVLAVSRFSLRSQAERNSRVVDRASLIDAVDQFLAAADFVDPTDTEISLAASLEEAALNAAVALDGGESQLVAILVTRGMKLLVTGDKRAIHALGIIAFAKSFGRIACLEQVLLALIEECSGIVREQVCREPAMEKAITACFGCSNTETTCEDINTGLASYIRHLREASGPILIEGKLSAVIA